MSQLSTVRNQIRDIINQIPAFDVSGLEDASRIKIGYQTFTDTSDFLNELSTSNLYVSIDGGFDNLEEEHGEAQYSLEQEVTFYFGISKNADNDLQTITETILEAKKMLMSQTRWEGICQSPYKVKITKTQLDTNNTVLAWSYKFVLSFMLSDELDIDDDGNDVPQEFN